MNKLSFLLVFIAGLVFALILPILKTSLESLSENIKDLDIGIGSHLASLSSDGDTDLLDAGYITLSQIRALGGDTALSMKEPTEILQKNDQTEAESCLRVGERLLKAGNLSKAKRLLERAVALAPSMPQALLALGEFMEQHDLDVVRADQLYVRALMISPRNMQAIKNRIRTKDLVVMQDLLMLKQVELKRLQLREVPSNAPALKRIQKEAYLHHIHHTVAIEGNTMTLEEIRYIIETGRSVAGKTVAEHTEVVGVDSALRYINNSLLHRVGAITLDDLLAIHLRVLGHTDPPAAGHLRNTQVFVGPHLPPAPSLLQQLMEQFIDWLNDPATVNMHPIRYAALAHYHLVYIHPFVDGNGRTARLLMNFLLMQAGYPPIIIRHQDRLQYYDSLQAANEGDTRPFVRFISHCTEKTIDVYLWATQDATPGIEQEDSRSGARDLLQPGTAPAPASSPRYIDNMHPLHQHSNEVQDVDEDTVIKSDTRTQREMFSDDKVTLASDSEDEDHDLAINYDDYLDEDSSSAHLMDESTDDPHSGDTPLPPSPGLRQVKRKSWNFFAVDPPPPSDEPRLDADHFDDLGVLFHARKARVAGGGAPSAHQWLNGGGSGSKEYTHSSRYYSKRQLRPEYRDQAGAHQQQQHNEWPDEDSITSGWGSGL